MKKKENDTDASVSISGHFPTGNTINQVTINLNFNIGEPPKEDECNAIIEFIKKITGGITDAITKGRCGEVTDIKELIEENVSGGDACEGSIRRRLR